MSTAASNIEVVRAIYEAFDRGDADAALERFHPDVEWYGPPDISGGADSWRGREGVTRALATWIGTWDDYRFELRELLDSGEHVFAGGWQRGRGKGSGVEVSEEIFSVYTLRDGMVVGQRMFRDRSQALRAGGLDE